MLEKQNSPTREAIFQVNKLIRSNDQIKNYILPFDHNFNKSDTLKNGLQAKKKPIDFMLLLTMEHCLSLVEGEKALVEAQTELRLFFCL